jgi:hypothetical protein
VNVNVKLKVEAGKKTNVCVNSDVLFVTIHC